MRSYLIDEDVRYNNEKKATRDIEIRRLKLKSPKYTNELLGKMFRLSTQRVQQITNKGQGKKV